MIQFILDNVLRLVVLHVLLAGVAIFSASETALFNLTRHQINLFKSSVNPLSRLAARLMRHPEGTLITVLLSTMICSVLFYSVSSILLLDAMNRLPGWQSTIIGILPLVGSIFLGGVLPKVVAVTYPSVVAILVAGPLYVVDRVIWPVRQMLLWFVVTPFVRLLSPPEAVSRPVGHEELQELLEHSTRSGHLAPDESLLLQEVVELGTIKVREVAIPRVDMVMFNMADSRDEFLRLVKRTGVRRVLAYREDMDHPVGLLDARQIVLDSEQPLDFMLQPVWYIPENKTIDSLLRDFQQTGREVAVAVDEYGGVTGFITLHHIIEELVGEMFDPVEMPMELVRQLDADTYLISGRLSIREWAQAFRQRFADLNVNTVGGLITARLGRIAKPGDVVSLRNLRFTVTQVHRNRILEVRLERLTSMPRSRKEARS